MRNSIYVADESVLKKLKRLDETTFENKKLHEDLNYAFDRLQNDPFSGTNILKKLIPLAYLKKYRLKNLWKYNLPDGWRLLYYVVNDEDETKIIIIGWMSHKEYERLFSYS